VSGNRRWWFRLAGGVLAFAGIEAAVLLIHGRADELRLALVVGLVVCASGLLVDSSPVEAAVWSLPSASEGGLGRLDPRTASYLRIVESHLSARDVDSALRDRLRELADQTLRTRHDVTVEDPRARELLGAELWRVVTDRPFRLDPDRIERCVRGIEEL
jgi:hypothetical protein